MNIIDNEIVISNKDKLHFRLTKSRYGSVCFQFSYDTQDWTTLSFVELDGKYTATKFTQEQLLQFEE